MRMQHYTTSAGAQVRRERMMPLGLSVVCDDGVMATVRRNSCAILRPPREIDQSSMGHEVRLRDSAHPCA
jgi:hypothetical protein